jgi:hypothetical protein
MRIFGPSLRRCGRLGHYTSPLKRVPNTFSLGRRKRSLIARLRRAVGDALNANKRGTICIPHVPNEAEYDQSNIVDIPGLFRG